MVHNLDAVTSHVVFVQLLGCWLEAVCSHSRCMKCGWSLIPFWHPTFSVDLLNMGVSQMFLISTGHGTWRVLCHQKEQKWVDSWAVYSQIVRIVCIIQLLTSWREIRQYRIAPVLISHVSFYINGWCIANIWSLSKRKGGFFSLMSWISHKWALPTPRFYLFGIFVFEGSGALLFLCANQGFLTWLSLKWFLMMSKTKLFYCWVCIISEF